MRCGTANCLTLSILYNLLNVNGLWIADIATRHRVVTPLVIHQKSVSRFGGRGEEQAFRKSIEPGYPTNHSAIESQRQ